MKTWHPGFCQGKTWYTSFSPGACTSPPGKYQGKTWWTDLGTHPRFPPGFYQVSTRFLPGIYQGKAMVKSWYPGKVQALSWQSPRRLPGGKLSFGLIPVAFAGRCSPGKHHGEKLVHQVFPRGMPGHQVFTRQMPGHQLFPRGERIPAYVL